MKRMLYIDLLADLIDLEQKEKDWVYAEKDGMHIIGRDGVDRLLGVCSECGERIPRATKLYYDEINRRVMCLGCTLKIKPRHEAGADQSSLDNVIRLPPERGQIRE